jgi:peptidoglycan hydrolase-like protein with peptidoglycan-binding domain
VTSYPNPTHDQVLRAFDRFGVRYVVERVVASRECRPGRWPNGLRVLIDHHTAGTNSLGYLLNRGGTYPLVNTLIDRTGLVHVLSTGSCWGTGKGGPWPGVAGKDSLHLVGWSTEVEDRGQGRTFTDFQLESLGRQNAALVSLGVPADHEINHRDWTDGTSGVSSSVLPTRGRKADTRYETAFLRSNTAAYARGDATPPNPPPVPPGNPPKPTSYRQGKKVYRSKMRQGQTNSDSVWNVTVALADKSVTCPRTGDYTETVKEAVARFQRQQGWSGSGADGIVGAQTALRLGLVWVDDGPTSPPVTTYTYRQGKKVYKSKMHIGQVNSDSVWNLCVGLREKGYFRGTPIDDYTKPVKDACATFQRAQGWKGSGADGIAGPATIRRLGLTWVEG